MAEMLEFLFKLDVAMHNGFGQPARAMNSEMQKLNSTAQKLQSRMGQIQAYEKMKAVYESTRKSLTGARTGLELMNLLVRQSSARTELYGAQQALAGDRLKELTQRYGKNSSYVKEEKKRYEELTRAYKQSRSETEQLERERKKLIAKESQLSERARQEEAKYKRLGAALQEAGVNTSRLAQEQNKLESASQRLSNANARLTKIRETLSWAILKALSMIGIEGEFLHWKDTGDEPYTFRIKAKITGDFYRTQGRDKIIKSTRRAVMESKAARSLFAGLETSIEFKDSMKIYAGLFDALTGFQIIGLARIESPDSTGIYAGVASGLQGEQRILPAHEKDIDSEIYTGTAKILNISHEIGLEEDVMQELLLRFEARIFQRLDQFESNVNQKIKEHEIKIDNRLNEILELLRWKGPDEPLD